MVAQVALGVWIFVALILYGVFTPLRAFLLTYVIGLLFLPVETTNELGYHFGSIVFTQSLRIDRIAACNIGALLGTIFFAPHVFRRFRFQWLDIAFLALLAGQFFTSVVNDLGSKDGFSSGVQLMRDYLPMIFLARLYLTSHEELLEAMQALLGGAFVYVFICVAEWRLAPQFHSYVYGYFQHDFLQHMRSSHFRPVGFMRHAIEVSVFMAFASVLAAWLMVKRQYKPLWGFIPGWVLLPALLLGLATTMTFSGYSAFLICALILGGFMLFPSRWFLWVLPSIAVIWMIGRTTGAFDATTLVDFSRSINSSRTESLEYRLQSEQVNLASITNHALLGEGAMNGAVRDDEGRLLHALDAWWLIQLVFFGFVGLATWCCVWAACIVETTRRWRTLSPDLQSLSVLVCVLIGAQFIDFLFNAFPSMFLMMFNVGLISVLQHERTAHVFRKIWIPNPNGIPVGVPAQ